MNFNRTTPQQVAGHLSEFVDEAFDGLEALNNGSLSTPVTVNGTTTLMTPANQAMFIRLIVVVVPIYDHLLNGTHVYNRGLWYLYVHYLGKDNISHTTFSLDLKHLSKSVSVPLQALHVKEQKRTWIFGQIVVKFVYKDGSVQTLDLSLDFHGLSVGDEPISVDMNTGNIESVAVSTKDGAQVTRLIVVEKHCLFSQMNENGFGNSVEAVLICSGGFPSKNSKAWVKSLKDGLGIEDRKCCVVHDFNPAGYVLGHAFSTNSFHGYDKYQVPLGIVGLRTGIM